MVAHEPLFHTSNKDFAQHEETFRLFMTMMKYLTVFCVLLLMAMAYFLL